MPKTKISEFSATPANNTDIDSINIAEGCAPSGINDAIRELMSQLKDFQTGAVGDSFNGPVGSTTASTGAFTTLTTTGTINLLTVGRGAGAVASNTVVGSGSLNGGSQTGTFNTVVGYQAATANTTGNSFVAIGPSAFAANTTGSDGVAIGSGALAANTTGSTNHAVGRVALLSNTTGSNNSAFGGGALQNNTTASNNTAVGYQAGYANTTGDYLSALGYQAALSNTTGRFNIAVGALSLGLNTTGSNNVAVGLEALYANTTANNNVAAGYQALKANTTGTQNVAIGSGALQTNTTSSRNTAVGLNALNLSTSVDNTAMGFTALAANTTGNNNTAVGSYALQANTTASTQTAVGYQAGYGITTGGGNTCIGQGTANYSGSGGAILTTGYNNTYLGNYACASASNSYGEMVIAASGNGTQPVGKGSHTGFIYCGGGGVYQGNNGATWSVTSDQRLKKNIVDNNVGLNAINSIRVRNFEYRLESEITDLPAKWAIQKEGVQLGVIAQELQAVLPNCVKTESTGVMSVQSDNLTWYLVNAIKELNTKFEEYKSTHP
jgi:hypothetical protein